MLTANHVVKKAGYGLYEIITYDGQKYEMENKAQTLGKLDLALVKFTSSKNYPLAKIADSQTIKEGARVYYAGFPAIQPRYDRFIRAGITGRSQNQEGYELSYNGQALPGMSGGPVLNEEGLLIAIHGKAETQSIIIQGVQRTEIVGVQGIPTEKFP
ncbi:MAG: serine protease, partial [Dolichospermum sp.]